MAMFRSAFPAFVNAHVALRTLIEIRAMPNQILHYTDGAQGIFESVNCRRHRCPERKTLKREEGNSIRNFRRYIFNYAQD
jgi:hypothetical protein